MIMAIKKVITTDGSLTYYNETFDEHYHCLRGALSEAEIKHLGPAIPFIKNNSVLIDYCFGLGYNAFAALVYAEKNKIENVTVVCLENDPQIILEIPELGLPKEYLELQSLFRNIYVDYDSIIHLKYKSHNLILVLGDAQETLHKVPVILSETHLNKSVDVIFFDPFSPKKCPALWTQEIFNELFQLMGNKSILTTYSCARHVRDKLKQSGFRVEDGPVYGRKAPATLGLKD
jgi:tRNA U34 5-methylaminomethyl-2-thiouridine-forming methyltransferase MnmC